MPALAAAAPPAPGAPPSPRRAAAAHSTAPGGQAFRYHLAPMREYTDGHLRHLFSLLSGRATLWTEMDKAPALLAADPERVERLLAHSLGGHRDVVWQVGGDDPEEVAQACRLALPYSYSELNLNAGCPGVETGGGRFGAALMRQPTLAQEVVAAMVDTAGPVPVSVKCRVGVLESAAAGFAADDGELYGALEEFVAAVAAGGASHVVVHAREAVLGGLSPAANRSVPPLRPRLVHRLAAASPGLAVTVNGGVGSFGDVAWHRQQAPELAGVMVGRWALRQPWDLLRADDEVFGDPEAPAQVPLLGRSGGAPPAIETRRAEGVIDAYAAYADRALAGGAPRGEVVRPLALLALGLEAAFDAAEGGSEAELAAVGTAEHLADAAGGLLGCQVGGGFRQLRKALSRAMGKKSFSKVRRNASEAPPPGAPR